MPRIYPYEQQYSAQGSLPGREAGTSDFTSATGATGQGLQNAGETLYKVAEDQEVSDVYARLAKARADWTVALQQRAESGESADPNFRQKFMDDFSQYLDKSGDGLQTRGGQQTFQRGAAQLMSHLSE